MNLKLLIVSAATVMALSSSAHALNFDFSFSNGSCGGCNVPGTVTGEIFGLTDNSTSSATNVVVNSFPAGITPLPFAAPFNVPDYAAALGQYINGNSFTVTNGVVTDADYQIFGGYFDLNINGQFNTLASSDAATRVQNLLGLAGVTFSATPLPSTWLMLLSGFVGLGFFAYRGAKKRSVLAAA